MIPFADAMTRMLAASALDAGLVGEAFEAILSGEWTPVQVGAFASAVRVFRSWLGIPRVRPSSEVFTP